MIKIGQKWQLKYDDYPLLVVIVAKHPEGLYSVVPVHIEQNYKMHSDVVDGYEIYVSDMVFTLHKDNLIHYIEDIPTNKIKTLKKRLKKFYAGKLRVWVQNPIYYENTKQYRIFLCSLLSDLQFNVLNFS